MTLEKARSLELPVQLYCPSTRCVNDIVLATELNGGCFTVEVIVPSSYGMGARFTMWGVAESEVFE